MGNYLAIEIGASEGHHYLGHLENGKLKLEEIHRFCIKAIEKEGEYFWDIPDLFHEIKAGLIKCRENRTLPILVGIDTWVLDYFMLDSEDNIMGNSIPYQKEYSQDTMDGLQSQPVINHLKAYRENNPVEAERMKTLLLLTDYLNFLLTGVKLSEYTMAAATKLVKPAAEVWDEEEIGKLGYTPDIFQRIRRPGAVVGNLTREVTDEIGYDCIIILPATYALSSAVFSLPSKEVIDLNNISKLWSLMYTTEDNKEYPASAVGNLLVQLIISHELQDVQAAHECVQNSFIISKYE